MFFYKGAILKDNLKFSVVCIVTERKDENMLLIFKKENETHNNEISDDNGAYEHFFSIFVHEITNPLSSIKMASQLVEKSKTYDAELGIINNESTRISKIINSISQISSKLVLKNKAPKIYMRCCGTVHLNLKIKSKK